MIKFENVNKLTGCNFYNGRFIIYKVEDSLVKTYFYINDSNSPIIQRFELRKEANPVYILENTFNRTMVFLDLETIKDMILFLKKIESLIDTSVTWE